MPGDRFPTGFSPVELAEDYEYLVRDGARVAPWSAGESTRSRGFKLWAAYLRSSAELDGLRINHSWYWHISFIRPVMEVAQRANGRCYDLPLWALPPQTADQAEPRCARTREPAALRATPPNDRGRLGRNDCRCASTSDQRASAIDNAPHALVELSLIRSLLLLLCTLSSPSFRPQKSRMLRGPRCHGSLGCLVVSPGYPSLR